MNTRARGIKIFITNVIFNSLNKTGIPIKYAIAKLKKESAKCKSLEDYVDLALNFSDRFPFRKLNIKPLQVKEEILGLLSVLEKIEPKMILEIGTAKGGTLFLLSRVASPGATIISIDLPGGPFGGGYEQWRRPLYRSFARGDQEIHLIRADSHNPETVWQVEKIIGDGVIDFMFIDGDHTYAGVKEDYETYSPFVGDLGMIAFHDIVENPYDSNWQVYRFWDEIKNRFEYTEFVSDAKVYGYICGIGLIHIKNQSRT